MAESNEVERRELAAEIVELRFAREEVVLRLPDGRDVRAWLPDDFAETVDVSSRVDVYMSARDDLLGWYLPDRNVGVLQEG